MALTIQTNVASLQASRNATKNQAALSKSFNKLSSGFRVNSAADDAAGLAISESMKSQIRSYSVAERNAADGISMSETAEGALGEVHDVLGRMRELATQAANETLSTDDRAYLDSEFQEMLSEITRIKDSTTFNGMSLLDGTAGADGTLTLQVGLGAVAGVDTIDVDFAELTVDDDLSGSALTDAATARGLLSTIDDAIGTVSEARSNFGAAMNRLEIATNNIQSMRLNLSAANSRIRDVDVAEESSKMAKNQVLSQASISVLAQANQLPQLAFSLIGG